MAFGFTPKFQQTIALNGFDRSSYLAIALAAVKQLKWDVSYTSESGLIAYIGGGIFSSAEEFKLVFTEDEVHIVSSLLSNGMYDWGKNKANVEEFLQLFDTIQDTTTDEEMTIMVGELSAVLASQEEDLLALPPATAADNLKSFISFFIPRSGYYITPVMIDINILMFIIMAIAGAGILEPNNEVLLTWGANFRPLTMDGEWWRLITNVFIHIGIIHLLFNMYALMYIGLLLEPYLGKLKFVTAYLFTGVIASLSSLYWHQLTVSAGASGAIFGMYGVFLAMLTTNFIDRSVRKALLTSIGVFVVFNLMNGMKAGIDNAAHIGGLLSGLVIGYIFYPSLKSPSRADLKYLTLGMVTIGFAITSVIIYKHIPDDMVRYQAKMKNFADKEEKALMVFKLPANAPKDKIQASLDSGINDWNDALVLIKQMNKLDIPVELIVRDNLLTKYCQLRIKSFQFIKMAVSENTSNYEDSVKNYDQQIEAVLNDLKQK